MNFGGWYDRAFDRGSRAWRGSGIQRLQLQYDFGDKEKGGGGNGMVKMVTNGASRTGKAGEDDHAMPNDRSPAPERRIDTLKAKCRP
mmetsp:Transcript_29073/g.61714  ORF Transcript_29073/g.61714 Transcript_29073/m.61714 type:complete len:87 (-) Transcript_29073:106-366(-)